MSTVKSKVVGPRWRLVSVKVPWTAMRQIGIWQVLYGADLFFNDIPLGKVGMGIVIVGIVVWWWFLGGC